MMNRVCFIGQALDKLQEGLKPTRQKSCNTAAHARIQFDAGYVVLDGESWEDMMGALSIFNVVV